jgi:hypothetical protein
MTEAPFSNREVLSLFKDQSKEIKDHVSNLVTPLTEQVKYTNGRVKRLYMYLTIIGTAVVTLLATNSAEFIGFIKLFL